MLSNNEKLIAVIGATGQRGAQLYVPYKPAANPRCACLGSDSYDQIALANKIAGGRPTKFSAWARVNFPASRLMGSSADVST
jgi:hypothetical protein